MIILKQTIRIDSLIILVMELLKLHACTFLYGTLKLYRPICISIQWFASFCMSNPITQGCTGELN
jgi:hypothetical protein